MVRYDTDPNVNPQCGFIVVLGVRGLNISDFSSNRADCVSERGCHKAAASAGGLHLPGTNLPELCDELVAYLGLE